MTSETVSDMKTIEKLAEKLAEKRDALANAVNEAQAEIDEVRERVMPDLRERIAAVAKAETKLRRAVVGGAAEFRKPRTRIMHGLRVGMRRGKSVLIFKNPDDVVALIDKHLSDKAETLVNVTRKPAKSELAKLDPRTLKMIGVRISDGVDEAVVEPKSGEIEAMTKALLSSMNQNAKD